MHLRALLEEKGFDRVPLSKMATGHYYCKVMLNKKKAIFIVDTGASTSCIGENFIDYFLLKSTDTDVLAAGAGATGMKTKSSKENRLKIGTKTITNMAFVIFDLSHVNEALLQVGTLTTHGILGADFLKDKRAVIDYGRNCMYLK